MRNLCVICMARMYVIHITTLKQPLDHGRILKKVHRVIELNKKVWMKSYVNINTEMITEAKSHFPADKQFSV